MTIWESGDSTLAFKRVAFLRVAAQDFRNFARSCRSFSLSDDFIKEITCMRWAVRTAHVLGTARLQSTSPTGRAGTHFHSIEASRRGDRDQSAGSVGGAFSSISRYSYDGRKVA